MELVIAELAKEDYSSIEEYTRDNWGELQADIYLSQIEHSILSLSETSYLRTARADVSDGYRCLSEGKHIIFYCVDDHVVNIIGVPHARMDLDHL